MSEKPKTLQRTQIADAEYASRTWCITPPPGTTLERLQEPDFYVIVGSQFGRGDILRVIDEASGLFAELLVREGRESNRTGFVSVTLLRSVELAPLSAGEEDNLSSGHSVQWMGESQRWACLRGSQILRAEFNTKKDALSYFGNLARAGAA